MVSGLTSDTEFDKKTRKRKRKSKGVSLMKTSARRGKDPIGGGNSLNLHQGKEKKNVCSPNPPQTEGEKPKERKEGRFQGGSPFQGKRVT